MRKRTPYRKPQANALARIDEKRQALGISHEDLYRAAEMSRATYYRMRSDLMAFERTVKALRFALRTIEQRQRAAGRILEEV